MRKQLIAWLLMVLVWLPVSASATELGLTAYPDGIGTSMPELFRPQELISELQSVLYGRSVSRGASQSRRLSFCGSYPFHLLQQIRNPGRELGNACSRASGLH